MPAHALAVGESVLVLFGADYFGQPSRIGAALALLHLAAVTVAALALLAGIRGFFGRLDRVGQVLVAGTIIMLAAGVFSTHVPNLAFAHEIAIVLPFCAVLAGRLLGAADPGQARAGAGGRASRLPRCAVLCRHGGARACPEPGGCGLAGGA